CAAACAPGLLLRAEPLSGGGMKGIFVSYAPDDTGAYAVTIDAQGKITSRERLRPGGGQLRFVANVDGTQPNAPQPARAAAAGPAATPAGAGRGGAPAAGGGAPPNGARGGGRGRAGMPEGYANPFPPPVFEFKPADWNDLEVQVDANVLRGWLNNGPEP